MTKRLRRVDAIKHREDALADSGQADVLARRAFANSAYLDEIASKMLRADGRADLCDVEQKTDVFDPHTGYGKRLRSMPRARIYEPVQTSARPAKADSATARCVICGGPRNKFSAARCGTCYRAKAIESHANKIVSQAIKREQFSANFSFHPVMAELFGKWEATADDFSDDLLSAIEVVELEQDCPIVYWKAAFGNRHLLLFDAVADLERQRADPDFRAYAVRLKESVSLDQKPPP